MFLLPLRAASSSPKLGDLLLSPAAFCCTEGKGLILPPLHGGPSALNPSLPAPERTCSKMKWQESSVTVSRNSSCLRRGIWGWTARVFLLGRVGQQCQLSWAKTSLYIYILGLLLLLLTRLYIYIWGFLVLLTRPYIYIFGGFYYYY